MRIYYVDLKNLCYADLECYAVLLPADRQEKIARYRYEADKLRSLIAGLLIRREIGDRPLFFGEHGKPYADGICFSVSHSGDMVAVVTDQAPLGIDVEALPEERRLKIADRFFSEGERRYVEGADDPVSAFCWIWTRKEAYLKMTGEGIAADLTAFDTTDEEFSSHLFSQRIGDYWLSVCSEKQIAPDEIYISILELNELF